MSSLRSAVHRAALGSKPGIEGLAAAMSSPETKVNAAILRNQLTGNDRHHLPIDRAEMIIDLTDSDELAHAAAQQRGGVFMKLPSKGESVGDLAVIEMITHVWMADGDIGRVVAEVLADRIVERSELPKVRQVIYRQQQKMMVLLQGLEQMAE